jgi:glycosyltransferase involved in cell wall biosynthesis
MTMKKVLQVITVPLGYDGVSMFVRRYAAAMNLENLRMDFLAINDVDGAVAEEIARMGCGLHVIKGRLRNPVRYAAQLARLVRREKYDVVHVHGNSCTMAVDLMGAYLGGAPVRAAHSHNTYCRFTAAHRLLRPAFDRLYTHAFACGDEAGRWLFGKKPFDIIRIAVDAEKYAFDPVMREEYRRRLGAGDELLIGCVAHFSPHKNHAFLIDAFAEYHRIDPSARLVLVGDGQLRGEVENAIARKKLEKSVILLGLRSDVAQIQQALDVMLLPSLFEGFPTVLMEWQCAGLRALVSDTVTRAAALTGLIQYLPISEGPAPWAEALMRLGPCPDRASASAQGIKAVKESGYDLKENAEALRRWYAGE